MTNSIFSPFSNQFRIRICYISIGIALGLVGLFYYANFRPESVYFNQIPGFSWLLSSDIQNWLNPAFDEGFPSFLHIVGMSFFTLGLIGLSSTTAIWVPSIWLFIDICFEVFQLGENSHLLALGNFEWIDLLALTLGWLITTLIFKLHVYQLCKFEAGFNRLNSLSVFALRLSPVPSFDSIFKFGSKTARLKRVLIVTMISTVGLGTIVGSYYPSCSNDSKSSSKCQTPIYMSWREFRTDQVLDPYGTMSLEQPGKQSLYNDLLLIGEKFKGIHIVDMSNSEAPEKLGFVSVLGAEDFIIKDDFLYVSAFTDLVVYDLNQIDLLPTRTENVFPEYDPYRFIDDQYRTQDYDESRGIIIGYRLRNGEEHFFQQGEF